MRFVRASLVLFVLVACKTHRLPELPADRDPVSPDAPVTDYTPPPDVLTKELSTGAAQDGADPHAGHHHHASEPLKEPANAPATKEPAKAPAKAPATTDPGGAP